MPDGVEFAGTGVVDVVSEAVVGAEAAGATRKDDGGASGVVGAELVTAAGDRAEGLLVTGEVEAAAPTPDAEEDAEMKGVLVPVAARDWPGGDVEAASPGGVLVAEAGVVVDVGTETAAGIALGEATEMIVAESARAELSKGLATTIRGTSCVVPSETVSCSSGLAKECQSNVRLLVVVALSSMVKPVFPLAVTRYCNAPRKSSGVSVTIGWWA